jgi:hypothetical protein
LEPSKTPTIRKDLGVMTKLSKKQRNEEVVQERDSCPCFSLAQGC